MTATRHSLALVGLPALGCGLLWAVAVSTENPVFIGAITVGSVAVPPIATLIFYRADKRTRALYAVVSLLLTVIAIAVVGFILAEFLGEIGPSNAK